MPLIDRSSFMAGVVAVLAVCLVAVPETNARAASPSPVASAKGPAPSPSPSSGAELPAKAAGTIDGHVASIDYKSGKMTVEVAEGGTKKSYDVLVVPGTSIQGKKDFHTIADLKRGAHVQVLMSRTGTTNTAQIITLL